MKGKDYIDRDAKQYVNNTLRQVSTYTSPTYPFTFTGIISSDYTQITDINSNYTYSLSFTGDPPNGGQSVLATAISPSQAVCAFYDTVIRAHNDGSPAKGYILARTNTPDGQVDPYFNTNGSCLYVKRLGSSVKYQLPQILPSFIPTSTYQGVFSNDGNSLVMYSASYNANSGDNYLYYVIFPNFKLYSQPSGTGSYIWEYDNYTNADGTSSYAFIRNSWAATIQDVVGVVPPLTSKLGGISLYSYNMMTSIRPVSSVPQAGSQNANTIYQAFQNQDQSNFTRFNPIVYEEIDYYGEGAGNSPVYPWFYVSETLTGNDHETVNWQADPNNQLIFSDFVINLGNDLTLQVLAGGRNTALYYISSEQWTTTLDNTTNSYGFCQGCINDWTSHQVGQGYYSYIYNYRLPTYTWTLNTSFSVLVNGLWDYTSVTNGYITVSPSGTNAAGQITNPDDCGVYLAPPTQPANPPWVQRTNFPNWTLLLQNSGTTPTYPTPFTFIPCFVETDPLEGCGGGSVAPQTEYSAGSIATDQIASAPFTKNQDIYFDGTVDNSSPGWNVIFNTQIPPPGFFPAATTVANPTSPTISVNDCSCGILYNQIRSSSTHPPFLVGIYFTTNCDTFQQQGPYANVFAWEAGMYLLTDISPSFTVSPCYGLHYPLASQTDNIITSQLFRNLSTDANNNTVASYGLTYELLTSHASGATYGASTYVNNALTQMGLDLATAESLGLTLADLQDLGGGGGGTSVATNIYYSQIINAENNFTPTTIAVFGSKPDAISDQIVFPPKSFPFNTYYLKTIDSYKFLGYTTSSQNNNAPVDTITVYNVNSAEETKVIYSGNANNVTSSTVVYGSDITNDLIMDYIIT